MKVAAAGTPGTLSDGDRDAIIETLRSYVTAATIDPLHGKPVGDLAKVFAPQALASLTGVNRDAVVDDGMPKATDNGHGQEPSGRAHRAQRPERLRSTSSGHRSSSIVQTKAPGGPVKVLRTGEVVLSHDAGTWKIASYKLTVDRTGAGLPAPSTASTEKTAP